MLPPRCGCRPPASSARFAAGRSRAITHRPGWSCATPRFLCPLPVAVSALLVISSARRRGCQDTNMPGFLRYSIGPGRGPPMSLRRPSPGYDWVMFDALHLARAQFAFTMSFHFVFPAFSIGLASYLMVLEALWLKTGKPLYLDLFKYWVKIF